MAVQHNCHISDARYAGNYTMCVYLLKMREFFRWEQAHGFTSALENEAVGKWLIEREKLWSDIEEHDYLHLDIDGSSFDPFNAQDINERLVDRGLVYSAGIGIKSKPHFFLGDLIRHDRLNGYEVYISSREHARDLTAPPAMSQGNTIYIRRESFKRMLWEKLEQWRWSKPKNAMATAIACYDFDGKLEQSLDDMTDHELESAILHEIGEIRAGQQLLGWEEMLSNIMFTQAEIMARAVRDHLADAISTLPVLLENGHHASIHFYIANLTNMRKHIFPSLIDAYNEWQTSHDFGKMNQMVSTSRQHWVNIANSMLEIFSEYGKNSPQYIEQLVESSHL